MKPVIRTDGWLFSCELRDESGDIPIREIDVGDEVLAYNEATGETDSYTVVATIHHTDPVIVLLTIDGETLETTADHPFYTADGEWVAAADLQAGDDILTLDGSTGEVEAVLFLERTQPMYNLTVDEAHTFFVGEGQWLVHNDDLCRGSGRQAFGETNFKGLKIDKPLRDLTHADLEKAFSDTPFNLSGHAISRLKHIRLKNLGVLTLRQLRDILNNGIVYDLGDDVVRIERDRIWIIVNKKTRKIITVRPSP